uniref:HTH CENPB-type domain-containing protein n=1 Tax=Angiostrongylus cantonensis TaxID=6313 RepID=A0A0K0DFZ5_ANGCA
MRNELRKKKREYHRCLGYAGHPGGGKVPMPMTADRRAVAEYARAYGGAAAAKRFGVPPPVSTYYHRKESNTIEPPYSLSHGNIFTLLAAVTASPGPSSEGEADTVVQQVASENTNPPPQAAAAGMFSPAVVDMLRMNAAHATGSPGFLRGRGRGRPKLIGDELDADLVDYMVTVKQADPHGHLTASQALIIAKQYILEKAPGLLEEHGGHVKLKLTWAMKLVSRIAERQKEMELGLPAGSLSNMGRLNNSLTGGGFMADMMTQNILSHHMMMNMNSQIKQEIPNTEEQKEDVQPAVGAPEILNIKELNLPFLNNLFGGSDENSGLIEGELPTENDQEMNLANAAN